MSLPCTPGYSKCIFTLFETLNTLVLNIYDKCKMESYLKKYFGPVYTIPFSFHIGLGKAIQYENFSCLHDAVFIS